MNLPTNWTIYVKLGMLVSDPRAYDIIFPFTFLVDFVFILLNLILSFEFDSIMYFFN